MIEAERPVLRGIDVPDRAQDFFTSIDTFNYGHMLFFTEQFS